jgi:hypothetical protein
MTDVDMIQFGIPLGFAGFANYPIQQAAQNGPSGNAAQTAQPSHNTANPTATANSGSYAMGMYPVAMMSPAYMMAYPQMSGPVMSGQGMPSAMTGNISGETAAAHVTANPTNAMASQNGMAAMGGYGGFGGVGVYGGMAMPVMMMAPVFMQMGYPMVFQGSVAQPPVAETPSQPPAVEPEVVDVPEPVAAPAVNTDGVVIDVVPESDDSSASLPALPISEMSADDFAKYRLVEKAKAQETQLSLSLTTKDGDQISLNFTQLDSLEMSNFRGKTIEGERVKDSSFREMSDRVVNMDVIGDLSDEEKAAVDAVLSTIVEAVNKFFSGDVGQAVAKLKQMDFDGQQLAELSLNMSMSKSVDITKAYHNGGDRLHDLMNRDADVNQALEFIASEQKRLIDVAKDMFDAPSAAKLVRSLVPPMLSEPFAQLSEQVSEANLITDAAIVESGAAQADVAEKSVGSS